LPIVWLLADYFRFEVETKKMPVMNTTDILSVQHDC